MQSHPLLISPLSPSQKGVGALSVLLHLTMKERPCHVYSDSMPLKKIIGQTITEPPVAQHSERHHVTVSSWCVPHYLYLSTQSCLVITFNELHDYMINSHAKLGTHSSKL